MRKMEIEIPSISIIGLLALSVIFGWFRYGYGLLVPEFKQAFGISASTLGVISSLSFVSFLAGVVAVLMLVSKFGSRPVILIGILAASTGLLMASLTSNPLIFTVGCVVAGLSPGLTWSSFSENVSQNVKKTVQERSLAVISTGSTLGLIVISTSYLFLDGQWRIIWIAGSVIGFMIFIWAFRSIPSSGQNRSGGKGVKINKRSFLTKNARPLYVASLLFGITEATYWTYAADFVKENFFVDNSNAIFFLITGLGGIAGLWAGDLINKLGLKICFAVTILLYSISMVVLFISQSWLFVGMSGLLFGSTFMLYAAYLPIWSAKVFPDTPEKGFSVSVILLNIGAIIGPAVFGGVLKFAGYDWVFLIIGLIACLKVLVMPKTRKA